MSLASCACPVCIIAPNLNVIAPNINVAVTTVVSSAMVLPSSQAGKVNRAYFGASRPDVCSDVLIWFYCLNAAMHQNFANVSAGRL